MKKRTLRFGLAAASAVALPLAGSALFQGPAAVATCSPYRPVPDAGVGYAVSPGPFGAGVEVCVGGPGGTTPVDNDVYAALDPRYGLITGPAPGVHLGLGYAVCTHPNTCEARPVLEPRDYTVDASCAASTVTGNPHNPLETNGTVAYALHLLNLAGCA